MFIAGSHAAAPFHHPREKLSAISPRARQLWVVAYVNQQGGSPLREQAVRDIDASIEGGADAVVLINEWSSLSELEDTLAFVRPKYPSFALGVNYLGDESEPYGFRDSFRLARDYDLKIVWTDFSGVDLIEEKSEISLHEIEKFRSSGAFYCSGVHMKYSTLKDAAKPIELSALQAMGWVDGVVVTGPKTGIACNPEIARRARAILGDYPLGVASGVSAENVHELSSFCDFYLVASSLQDQNKRIRTAAVSKLRAALA
jgi:hypothetical protein